MGTGYFEQLARQQQVLERHGFDHYPSEEELLEYALSLEDRIDKLCEYPNVHLEQDVRGRWHVEEGKVEEW